MQNPSLGIDFGGVVVTTVGRTSSADRVAPWRQSASVAQDGAFDGVKAMVQLFESRVFIVSKAGPAVAERTRRWLTEVDLYGRTGLVPANVIFCRKRADKAGICRERGITHFIDDRIHIMQILKGVVAHLYLFCADAPPAQSPKWATRVQSWPDAVASVRSSLLSV